jgi:large subunit ribosomal protein L1
MAKLGKNHRQALEKFDRLQEYNLEAAVKLLKELAYCKFPESVDLSFRLGVDPRHADQMVRGSVVLPHGTGKEKKVLVFCKGEKVAEANAAGADFIGDEDTVKRIEEGWFGFDAVVATPDTMKDIGKLGKYLGRRGLMPSPKTGTVTFDLAPAIAAIKAGKVDFRVDKAGNLHIVVGRISFTEEQLLENLQTAVEAVVKAKPPASKGTYIKRMTVSSTMGPGVRLDRNITTAR